MTLQDVTIVVMEHPEESLSQQLYAVETEPAELDVAAERRYIATETEFARRELAKTPKRSRWPLSKPELGLARAADWHRYIHGLAQYGRELERYEQRLQNGLIPCIIQVYNLGSDSRGPLKIRVTLEGGRIALRQHEPQRPPRIDGAPEKVSAIERRVEVPLVDPFVRRGVRVTEHHVEAEFSTLKRGEDAMLVPQVLYVESTAHTHLYYELQPAGLAPIRGEVD